MMREAPSRASMMNGVTLYPISVPHNEYTLRLEPALQVRRTGETDDPVDSKASGTVWIGIRNDSTFEYRVTIINPAGETFTGAHLHRGAAGENGPAIATLFSDAMLAERHVQVRGMGEIARVVAQTELIQLLREAPGEFYVNVHSTGDPRGALRGRLLGNRDPGAGGRLGNR